MPASPTSLIILGLLLVAAVLTAALAAIGAALLARADGASIPAAVLRAGVAFGGCRTLFIALLAVGLSVTSR